MPAAPPPNTWHLRKSAGETYGPVDLVALREWAGDGRVAPDDMISTDGEDWRPAYELDSLGMVWLLELADGQTYGPAHRGAFEDMLKNGDLDPPLHLRHRLTGAEKILGAAAPPAPATHRGDTQPIAEAPDESEAPAPPEANPAVSAEMETLARDRDRFAREAAHWRSLYETESGALRETAARLSDAVRQSEALRAEAAAELEPLRAELADARTGLETCRIELDTLRATPTAAKADDGGAPADVAQVCRDLMVNYDRLVAQFAEKTVELRQAREEADVVRTESEARVKVAEDYAARERRSAETARRRLGELESSYADIVKSYRDINNRFILMRERQTSGRSSAAAGSAAETPPAAAPAPPESKPRIRLRR